MHYIYILFTVKGIYVQYLRTYQYKRKSIDVTEKIQNARIIFLSQFTEIYFTVLNKE